MLVSPILVIFILLAVHTALAQSFFRKHILKPRFRHEHSGADKDIPPSLKTLRAGAVRRYQATSSRWLTSTNLVQVVTLGASAAGKPKHESLKYWCPKPIFDALIVILFLPSFLETSLEKPMDENQFQNSRGRTGEAGKLPIDPWRYHSLRREHSLNDGDWPPGTYSCKLP